MQTLEEKKAVMEFWWKTVKTQLYPDFADSHNNGVKVAQYIADVFGGAFTPQNITASVEALKNNLEGLGVATPEQKAKWAKDAAEKAKTARQEKISQQNEEIYAQWIKNECPLGLLVNGGLLASTQDKLAIFIRRNFPTAEFITSAMLSQAVTTLSSSLDWYSSKSEDRVLRNQPAPSPRKLSEKAQREAGMIPERLKGHEDDGKLINPAEALKKIAQKVTGHMQDPYETRCQSLTVTNRYGRTDHGFLAKLNQTFAKNGDGSVNWKETYRLRNAACDQYERTRNRD